MEVRDVKQEVQDYVEEEEVEDAEVDKEMEDKVEVEVHMQDDVKPEAAEVDNGEDNCERNQDNLVEEKEGKQGGQDDEEE